MTSMVSHRKKSVASMQRVPEAVLQEFVMPFLGPRDLLPTLGSCSKTLRRIATSDMVWQEFCRWRGTTKSLVCQRITRQLKKALENIQDENDENYENFHVQVTRSRELRAVFVAFEDASTLPGSYARYKALHLQGWPERDVECAVNSEDFLYWVLDWPPQCHRPVEFACQLPSCHSSAYCKDHMFYSNHGASCSWCKAQYCTFDLLTSLCTRCKRAACKDCEEIVGLGSTSRCDSDDLCVHRTCWKCSWWVKGEDSQAGGRPFCSPQQFETHVRAVSASTFCGEQHAGQEANYRLNLDEDRVV